MTEPPPLPLQVSVPAPDPALQPTFDPDSNGHRYRFLEAAGGWVVRPFVEAHGVDHDDGVEGFSCEKGSMLRRKGQYLGGIPANAMFQLQKVRARPSLLSPMRQPFPVSLSLLCWLAIASRAKVSSSGSLAAPDWHLSATLKRLPVQDKNTFSFNGEAEASYFLNRNIVSTGALEVQTVRSLCPRLAQAGVEQIPWELPWYEVNPVGR